MQPRNIQSVHGFLTPKRILSSLMNPAKNSKINRSMTTEQINNTQRLDQSLGAETTPKADKETNKKRTGPADFQSQKQESANNFILDSQLQSQGNSRAKIKGETDNIDFIRVYDEKNGNSSRISRNSIGSKKKQNNNNEPQPTFNKKESSEINNADNSSSRRFIVPNKPRSEIQKLAIQETMKQLLSIKNSLEQQIEALKFLLDQTSSSLQSMDREFQQFKEKILIFTSKSLDSAFREYKKHLPNWSIYEQVEEKGLSKIAQINQSIEICQNYDKLKSMGGKQAIERSFPQLKAAVREIKQARLQCYSQRPIISYEKINKLEGVLRQIGEF